MGVLVVDKLVSEDDDYKYYIRGQPARLNAEPKDYPYAATIVWKPEARGLPRGNCNGNIVTTLSVITVCSCVTTTFGERYEVQKNDSSVFLVAEKWELGVMAGHTYCDMDITMSLSANLRNVTHVTIHPQCHPEGYINNYAFIMVSKPFIISDRVGPIHAFQTNFAEYYRELHLITQEDIPCYMATCGDYRYSIVKATGKYDRFSYYQQLDATMKSVRVRLLRESECKFILKHQKRSNIAEKLNFTGAPSPHVLCGQALDTTTCLSDAGAGLKCLNRLVGMYHQGYHCEDGPEAIMFFVTIEGGRLYYERALPFAHRGVDIRMNFNTFKEKSTRAPRS